MPMCSKTMKLLLCLCACIFASVASAAKKEAPTGAVVLTVSGAITHENGDGIMQYDMEMLRTLGEREFTTTTIWTEGEKTFSGVSLHVLLDHVGANGTRIDATAINDYKVQIPATDAHELGPIIAYEIDGNPMSRREKGPLWVIYHYDSDPVFRTEVIYSRSIWQLDRIEILE